jgi:hypothetical protein
MLDLSGIGVDAGEALAQTLGVKHGVGFDINATGQCLADRLWGPTTVRWRWTVNGNGQIDNGAELFAPPPTEQRPPGRQRFHALAQSDSNQDGKIRPPTASSSDCSSAGAVTRVQGQLKSLAELASLSWT